MTLDELLSVKYRVHRLTEILGKITQLKERIAWLESGEKVTITFNHAGTSTASVSDGLLDEIHKLLLVDLKNQVDELQAEFDGE